MYWLHLNDAVSDSILTPKTLKVNFRTIDSDNKNTENYEVSTKKRDTNQLVSSGSNKRNLKNPF